MENPIYKAYALLDRGIMTTTKHLFEGYNWVTGRNKKDFANDLYIAGWATLSLANFLGNAKLFAPMFALINATQAIKGVHQNNIMYQKEQRALEQGLLDETVEKYKLNDKKGGKTFLAAAYLLPSIIPSQNPEFDAGWIATGSLLCLSGHAMSLDDLPKKKNCVARGLEKLTEALAERQLQPAKVSV